jgi:hypothetical protein
MKPGGKKGHEGHTYELVPDPDGVVDVTPQGLKYHPDYELVGEVKRQRVDTVSKRLVT